MISSLRLTTFIKKEKNFSKKRIMQLLCRQGKKGRAKKNVAVVGTAFLVFYDGIGTAFCRKNVSESVGGIWTVHPFGIGRLCCRCMLDLFSWEDLSVRL